eukprot:scaffold66018_cov26-Tisochrysis_lutea.AAC.3
MREPGALAVVRRPRPPTWTASILCTESSNGPEGNVSTGKLKHCDSVTRPAASSRWILPGRSLEGGSWLQDWTMTPSFRCSPSAKNNDTLIFLSLKKRHSDCGDRRETHAGGRSALEHVCTSPVFVAAIFCG